MAILRLSWLAALALTSATPSSAVALDVQHGNGLLDVCSKEDDRSGAFETGLCLGYIAGVLDLGNHLTLICYPPSVTNGQIRDIVVSNLRAHPEERHVASDLLAVKYLSSAFPCPVKK